MDRLWVAHNAEFDQIANAHFKWSCLKFNGMVDTATFKSVDQNYVKLEAMFGRKGTKRY